MKKLACAASLVSLTGAATSASQIAVAQSTPATDAPAATPAPTPATLTANVTLTGQCRCRGIIQTNNKPATQSGFSYAIPDGVLPEGFYIGSWNSSISWLSDSNSDVSAPIKMDFYGSYKTEIVEGVSIDISMLQYYYPGNYPDGFAHPHTTEGYAQIGYGPVMFKYSRAFSNLFGMPSSYRSQYFDLSGNFNVGFWGLTLNLHAGYQQMPHQTIRASYVGWKVGVTKDFDNGWVASLTYIDTSVPRMFYTNTRGSYMGEATAPLLITKILQ